MIVIDNVKDKRVEICRLESGDLFKTRYGGEVFMKMYGEKGDKCRGVTMNGGVDIYFAEDFPVYKVFGKLTVTEDAPMESTEEKGETE